MRFIDYKTDSGKTELEAVLKRTQLDYGNAPSVVADIIDDVRRRGDAALFHYTEKFDKAIITEQNIRITADEIKTAYTKCDKSLISTIKTAAERIRIFHEKQKRSGYFDTYENGEILGQLIRPVETAGVYCPGGTAAYPSSVLMNIIPAKVAGVPKIIMCTPPSNDVAHSSVILAAADIAGADEIYRIGGAQAIAAMAFGTKSVPRADKITGPGNIYVALAKRAVFGYVSIDSVAGPSEILIIADNTANPKFLAADLLSQAEHDALAAAILITTSKQTADETMHELEARLENLPRADIAKASIQANGAVVLVSSLTEAFVLANKIAPEHLELCISEAMSALPLVKNAGAVFVGHYTPEALGDYIAGPNHILPTGGTARFFSPLGVDDFYKKTSVLCFNKDAFDKLSSDCAAFAEAEGLFAHAEAVRVRL